MQSPKAVRRTIQMDLILRGFIIVTLIKSRESVRSGKLGNRTIILEKDPKYPTAGQVNQNMVRDAT